MKKKPVIFLAFANDRVDEAAYLRNLPKELDGIRTALQKAVRAGLCEVVERPNATIQNILDVFQDEYYQDRIAVFHYGGHANGYQLLLENLDGSHSSAHAEGLSSFLAKQKGLQLVFLNGCSSQQQALGLVEAGVAAVIGTSQSINDEVATKLSIRFYKGLAAGQHLEKAWAEAVDEVRIEKGTANMRDLFWEGAQEDEGGATANDHFPWEMHYKDGAEVIRGWNLPESVDNPLFGLPEPVQQDLPEEPYRFLERYKREHAPVFFGRSFAIRELFNRATDGKSAPIILFYGQSGVGKSSMLDAGLFPRLEQVAHVLYVRRDDGKGLLGSVYTAMGIDVVKQPKAERELELEKNRKAQQQLESLAMATQEEGIKERYKSLIQQLQLQREALMQQEEQGFTKAEGEKSLHELWLELEEKHNKPFILLLDQVEEVFTKPSKSQRDELGASLQAFYEVFSNREKRPRGKLILSYRKEYHPEIEDAFKKLLLPRERVFLKKLEKRDIEEVVRGLSTKEQLRRTYALTVDDQLPSIIADDLLEDQDSPIAPILQILMTKMWQLSEGGELRHFSVSRYTQLKKEGILMDNFFEEQMQKALEKHPELIKSGLALDLLYFHTTKLGTANSRGIEEVRKRYGERQDTIEKLIRDFKELYLLSDSGQDATGLAHDTLAPIVQEEFRRSDKPGQRASLILENKREAYRQNPNALLDLEDLSIVESGAQGMRIWEKKEAELVEKSRQRRDKILAEKNRIRQLGIAAIALIVLASAFALFKWQEAIHANETSQAQIYLMQAEKKYQEDPTQSLGYLRKAHELRPENKNIENMLVKAFYGQSRYPFYHKVVKAHNGWVENIGPISPLGNFYTAGNDEQLKFWSESGKLLATSPILGNKVGWVFIDAPKGDKLFVYNTNNPTTGRIYNAKGEQLASLQFREALSSYPKFSPNGKYLLATTPNHAFLYSSESGDLQSEMPMHGQLFYASFNGSSSSVFISSNYSQTLRYDLLGNQVGQFNGYMVQPVRENLCVVVNIDSITLANDSGQTLRHFYSPGGAVNWIEPSPQKNYFLGFVNNGPAYLWDITGRLVANIPNVKYTGNEIFSKSGNAMILLQQEAGKEMPTLWSFEGGSLQELYRFAPVGAESMTAVSQMGFSPAGDKAYVASSKEEIQVYSLKEREELRLKGHEYSVMGLGFFDNSRLVSVSRDSSMRFWDLTLENKYSIKAPAASFEMQLRGDKLLLGKGSGEKISLWDIAKKQELLGERSAQDATLSSDGSLLLSIEQGEICLYDIKGASATKALSVGQGGTGDRLAWAEEGQSFVHYSSQNHSITQWSVEGKQQSTYKLDSIPQDQALAYFYAFPEKQRLLFNLGTEVYLTDMEGKVLHQLSHNSSLLNLSVSPDGQYIATSPDLPQDGSGYRGACVWDWEGNLRFRLKHDFSVYQVAFSPDGQYLLTGSADNKAKLWRPDGTLVKEIAAHNEWVKDVAFSPNGEYFATASWDNTVRIWDLQGHELAKLEGQQVFGRVLFSEEKGHIVALEGLDKVYVWSPLSEAASVLEKSLAGNTAEGEISER